MITNSIIDFFRSVLEFIVNNIPTESPPFTETIINDTTTALSANNGGTMVGLIARSPVVVMVDFGILTFVAVTSMVVLFALFGAKVLIFIWQQVKW